MRVGFRRGGDDRRSGPFFCSLSLSPLTKNNSLTERTRSSEHTTSASLFPPPPPPPSPRKTAQEQTERERQEQEGKKHSAVAAESLFLSLSRLPKKNHNMASSSDPARELYRAVAAGCTADELRAAIEACAPPGPSSSTTTTNDRARRMAAAVNSVELNGRDGRGETPLQAAHRMQRGDLVGPLLEAGADAASLSIHRRVDPLAVCIAYGQAASLRALLRQGHDANRRVEYGFGYSLDVGCSGSDFCSPVHLCIRPPRLAPGIPQLPPQLDCLRVLVEEGGADVNARDIYGKTPLLWLGRADCTPESHCGALALLVKLGADVNARGSGGWSLVHIYAEHSDHPSILRRLLGHGASVDINGQTPLMMGCICNNPAVPELLRRSSIETRRAVDLVATALDYLASTFRYNPQPWHAPALAEMLRLGVPFMPNNAPILFPIAASLMRQQQLDLTLYNDHNILWDWRGHEAMVHLAFDMQDVRKAEQGTARREAEVRRLERHLAVLDEIESLQASLKVERRVMAEIEVLQARLDALKVGQRALEKEEEGEDEEEEAQRRDAGV
jgi:ankyrin repeat protein